MSGKKLSASDIVRHAIIWGRESIANMIEAHTSDTGEVTDIEHVAYLKGLHRQMGVYYDKRFGPRPDPFAGASMVDAMTLEPISPSPIKDGTE